MNCAAFRSACLALAFAWAPLAPGETPQVPLYRLPWPEGLTFMFSQAPGGMITTHVTRESRYAVDIPMPEGTPVLAARAGTVIEAEWRHGSGAEDDPLTTGGNLVRVRHADGTIANYAHLKHAGVAVEPGEEVAAGRVLGYSGTTGFSSGPHLHFGVTRLERAGGALGFEREGDALREVSVPVSFYVGEPPVAFAPRAALIVTADYSSRAEPPRSPREPRRLVEWRPRVLGPEELPRAWAELAAAVALALAGIAWFWRFSRS